MSKKEKYPSELAERFQVRLPDGLRDRIRAAAAENNRSMNAEIIARLEAAEAVPSVKADFELAKERILAAQRLETSLRKQIELLDRALEKAQKSNQRLIDILEKRLGTTPDETAAALAPDNDS